MSAGGSAMDREGSSSLTMVLQQWREHLPRETRE